MKRYIELDEKDIQTIIADYYSIPTEKMNEQVKINLGMTTVGYGKGEHQKPVLHVKVIT